MGRRHYTPRELCMMAKRVQENRIKCLVAPFSAMAIICCYVLWKEHGCKKRKLTQYFKLVTQYYNLYEGDEQQWDVQQNRLIDAFGEELTIYNHVADDSIIPISSKNPLYYLCQKEVGNNNIYSETCLRYLLAHFNSLLDLEWTMEEIIKNRDNTQSLMEKTQFGERHDLILPMREEMASKIEFVVGLGYETKEDYLKNGEKNNEQVAKELDKKYGISNRASMFGHQ